MRTIGVQQLRQETAQILREVREGGEEYVVTVHGVPAARLVPLERGATRDSATGVPAATMAKIEALAARITAARTSGLSAADLVAAQRR